MPSSIGALASSLTRVDLMDNRIAGSLPASLASLSSVTTAYFDDNADAFLLEPGTPRLVVARHAEDEGLAVAIQLEALVLGP